MNSARVHIFLVLAVVAVAWAFGTGVPVAQAAFPQVAGTATSSRASAALDDPVTLPASVAAGDLIIVFHFSDSGLTRTFPGSWAEIKDASCAGPACTVGVAYLIASGGETSVTVTKSLSERFSAIAVRISAVSWHGTTPPEISTGATGSSANPNPNAVTASWGSADNLFIAAMAWDDSDGGDAMSAYPTNYTGNQNTGPNISSAGRGAIASREFAAASDDPGTFTIPSDQWWAGTVVVRPAAGGDVTAPTPNPMTFASVPNDASTSSINMTATTASDPSTPIEYSFTFTACGSNGGTGGTSSSWQTSTSYTDTGLQVNKCYGYTVTARDSVPNTGTASGASQAYTAAAVPGTPTLSGATTSTLALTNVENGNPASSPTTLFAAQVVTTSPSHATWLNKYVDASGNPSASAVWLSDAALDAMTLRGLATSTTYGVKVKARNESSSEETALGSEGQGTTSAGGGGSPPNAPTQNAPANGATDQSVTPVFQMTATDPNSDKLQYKVTIYSNAGCSSVVQTNDQSSSQTGWSGQNTTCVAGSDCYTSGTQGTFTTQSALSNSTTYYWRASAKDPLGTNTFTDSATCNSFTTIASGSGLWTVDSGTWSIVSNAVTVSPAAATYNQMHVAGESRTDAVVDVRAKASITGSGDAGSVLRADASANRYQIGNLDFGGSLHRIRKVVATIATVLTSAAYSPAAGTYYQLRASLSGTSLNSWINGGTARSATNSELSSAGFVGLGAYRSGSAVTFTYADFAVYTSSIITLNNLPAGGSWAVLNSASAVIACRAVSTWDSTTYTGQIPIDYIGGGGKIGVWEDNATCSGAADVTYPSSGLATDIVGGDTYSYAAAGSGSAATATSGITISAGGLIRY